MDKVLPRSAYWNYVLAFLGAHLAFMPLLVLLLPRRVEALATADTPSVLSWLLLAGGVVAGFANVGAGALGDHWIRRFGSRRRLVAIGTGMLFIAYVGLAFANDIPGLFAALIFFQIALNCCFSPLGALLADHFSDEVKGRLGGLLTAGLPVSTLLVVPVAWLFPIDGPGGFLLVGSIVTLCMLPLLTVWGLGSLIEASDRSASGKLDGVSLSIPVTGSSLTTDFSLAWLSRLLVQTGAAFVVGYIYLYLSLNQFSAGGWSEAGASKILAALTAPSAIFAIIITILAGFLSDRINSRRIPLFAFACLFGLGLGMLAIASELAWFFAGYILLQAALAAYLSVDTALFAQLVSGHPRRGLLLGAMNLSNTLPSVIVPAIALIAFGGNGTASILVAMFWGFALAALGAGALVLLIRGVP